MKPTWLYSFSSKRLSFVERGLLSIEMIKLMKLQASQRLLVKKQIVYGNKISGILLHQTWKRFLLKKGDVMFLQREQWVCASSKGEGFNHKRDALKSWSRSGQVMAAHQAVFPVNVRFRFALKPA